MNGELFVQRVKQNTLGEFNEAGKPKTSLEFNFGRTNASASNTVFKAVRKTFHTFLYVKKVCGQTSRCMEKYWLK